MERQPQEQKIPINPGRPEPQNEQQEQPVQRVPKFPYPGTTWELLNTPAYAHNKDQPLWEYKGLHIGEHHKIKHLDLEYTRHKGPTKNILTGKTSPEGTIERDESGSPIPVDMSVYTVRGKHNSKSKSNKKSHKMLPFKGI